jgi:hypothetical protein
LEVIGVKWWKRELDEGKEWRINNSVKKKKKRMEDK